MKVNPLQDFVLVKPLGSEHKSVAEICFSDFKMEKTNSGAVIAASAGVKLMDGNWRPLNVKVGDKVLFGKLIGQPVNVDEEELLLMRENEIIAVVEACQRL